MTAVRTTASITPAGTARPDTVAEAERVLRNLRNSRSPYANDVEWMARAILRLVKERDAALLAATETRSRAGGGEHLTIPLPDSPHERDRILMTYARAMESAGYYTHAASFYALVTHYLGDAERGMRRCAVLAAWDVTEPDRPITEARP